MNEHEMKTLEVAMRGLLHEYNIEEYVLVGISQSSGHLEGVAVTEISDPQGNLILSELMPPTMIQLLVRYNHLPPKAAAAVMHAFVEDAGEVIDDEVTAMGGLPTGKTTPSA